MSHKGPKYTYEPKNPISRDVLNEYLTYKVEQDKVSPKTYQEYKSNIWYFCEFIEATYDNCNLLEAKSEYIVAFSKLFVNKRNATGAMRLTCLKVFYNWACAPNVLKIKSNPFPYIKIKSKPEEINFVPDPGIIFKVRNLSNGYTLQSATIFEMLLSTGMRIGELRQLRISDVNFKESVYDYELGKVSPYIGGSVNVSRSSGIRLKSKSRKVYFGKLAARLLRKYLKETGIEKAGVDVPLFPVENAEIQNMFKDIEVRSPEEVIVNPRSSKGSGGSRQTGFLDIDVDKLDAPEEYKSKLRKIQADERKRLADINYKTAVRIEKQRPIHLHPHSLRHTFAALMYYRNWSGQKHDILSVRDLLGHVGLNHTQKYVSYSDLCKSDSDWKRIFVGNDFEYLKLYRRVQV